MDNLTACASLNNRGIELEKAGLIDEAIKVYEDNIKGDCYPATHSFERLMVLYRRRKDYSNEIRVIEKAVSVFAKENLRRASRAITNNPDKKDEIIEALSTCKNVLGNTRSVFGGNLLYCFCPYDVAKYNRRLEKAKILLVKSAQKD